uniref:Macaca fascicularis brain cDNA, clone: QflA-20706 n=1 Tax=Macaca fascicularis TaxID=9541 RepID=I7G6M9_MACFA|nr:unnamed protein product [Macaca fascicularis]
MGKLIPGPERVYFLTGRGPALKIGVPSALSDRGSHGSCAWEKGDCAGAAREQPTTSFPCSVRAC